jgi:hypothetical protein
MDRPSPRLACQAGGSRTASSRRGRPSWGLLEDGIPPEPPLGARPAEDARAAPRRGPRPPARENPQLPTTRGPGRPSALHVPRGAPPGLPPCSPPRVRTQMPSHTASHRPGPAACTAAQVHLPPVGYPDGNLGRGRRGLAAPQPLLRIPPLSARSSAADRMMGEGCNVPTNLAGSGLRSVARNNKATRLLTRPGQTTKSSAKDLSLRIVKLQYAS